MRPPSRPVAPDPATDVASLRAFVAVARLGGVGRAAAALHRTQPALSARIAGLESAWGTRLFRREPRGMALTPEGIRLLPLAEEALRRLEDLDAAAGRPTTYEDEVRVGSGDALGRELLPRVLGRLLGERPRLEVRVLEGTAARLLDALNAGEIDVALLVPPMGQSAPVGLRFEPILSSRVDLLVPESMEFPRRKIARLRDLDGIRLVTLHATSSFRRHIAAAFDAEGISFRPAVEVGNLSLVRRFVAAGAGPAPVPAVAFGRGGPGLGVKHLHLEGIPPLRYVAALRDGAPQSAVSQRFLTILQDASGEVRRANPDKTDNHVGKRGKLV